MIHPELTFTSTANMTLRKFDPHQVVLGEVIKVKTHLTLINLTLPYLS